MEFRVKNVIIRRMVELLLSNIIFSFILTFSNVVGILNEQVELGFGSLMGVELFMLLNVKLSRDCYYDLRNNFNYYYSNIVSYLIFALISIIVYLFFPSYIFTWLFSITNVAKYSIFTVSTIASMLCFHAVGLLCVVIAPIGMGWVFDMIDNEMEK